MYMIVDKFISDESPRHVPRAFVVYELNLNSFVVHGIGVHDPSSENPVRIIAGAVEYQSIADPCSGVVLMDVSAKPQLRLHFFDPLSDGAATAATSIVEDITGTQGWRMSHHNSVSACIKFAQLVLQFVVVDFAVGAEWRVRRIRMGQSANRR